jgi:hypothetical protein
VLREALPEAFPEELPPLGLLVSSNSIQKSELATAIWENDFGDASNAICKTAVEGVSRLAI